MKLTLFEKATMLVSLVMIVGIVFWLIGTGSLDRPGLKKETSIELVVDELTGLPAEREQVNINTAPVEELQTLKGIGESLAERIVQYREENGPFDDIEELLNVSGIGSKKLEAIADSITAGR